MHYVTRGGGPGTLERGVGRGVDGAEILLVGAGRGHEVAG